MGDILDTSSHDIITTRSGSSILSGDPDWPQDEIRARPRMIREELDRLSRQINDVKGSLAGHNTFRQPLDLLADPTEPPTSARRALSQAFLDKIFLDMDDDGPYVAADAPDDLIARLVVVARNDSGGTTRVGDAAATTALNLRTALAGEGSSNAALVEVPGIEPGSFGESTGFSERSLLCLPQPHRSRKQVGVTGPVAISLTAQASRRGLIGQPSR